MRRFGLASRVGLDRRRRDARLSRAARSSGLLLKLDRYCRSIDGETLFTPACMLTSCKHVNSRSSNNNAPRRRARTHPVLCKRCARRRALRTRPSSRPPHARHRRVVREYGSCVSFQLRSTLVRCPFSPRGVPTLIRHGFGVEHGLEAALGSVLAATRRTPSIAESCASMERAFLFKPNLRIGLGSLSPLEAYQP